MRHIDLCTGIGGIPLAGEKAGMTPIAFAEVDPYCSQILAQHWPHVPNLGDLYDITAGRLDELQPIHILSAGFPCQPVSIAGKRRGAGDDRWLWPEVLRIIRSARPAWVLCENVPGLIAMGLDTVLGDLDSAGYEATACVYPASAVGAPHQRERIFIVAHSHDRQRELQELALRAGRHTADDGSNAMGYARHAQRPGRDAPTARGAGGAGTREPSRDEPAPHGVGVGLANTARRSRESLSPRRDALQPGRTVRDDADRRGTELGNTTRGGPRCRTASWQDGQPAQPDQSAVDDADSGRRDGWQSSAARRDQHPHQQEWTQGAAQPQAADARGVGLADACGERPQGRWAHGAAGQPRQAQSRLGGEPDGLPAWLDSLSWPAGPGEAQHWWEAPRTVTGAVPHRAARLKALGNAVVPAQVYPILLAIAETWKAVA